MNNKLIFILFKKKVISKWSIFKQSILYYPILISIIAFVGFLVTSRIDESFGTDFSIDIHYFSSLLFAGSADAARSILSTIAAGWVTILSVGFSVTLITLQLSITRYISYLVNKFESDRINKLTLGWFIATVLYSLLVLKTVRTGENTADIFIPIIGVNVAVVMASVGLFIFVLFLNNISSYLKPKILVQRLVNQIICSIKPFEKRDIDEKSLLHIQDNNETILRSEAEAATATSEQKDVEKVFEVESKEKEGIVRNIDWKSLSSSLKNLTKDMDQSHLGIEFHKFIGESVDKGNILVSMYGVNHNYGNNSKKKEEEEKDKEGHKGDDDREEKNNKKQQQTLVNNLEQKILSSIEINNDRDISRDPFYGIELLRTISIKSASNNDIDVTNACITGLFRVLVYILKNQDVFGIPFTIKVKNPVKNRKKERKEKQGKANHKNNNRNSNNNNNNNKSNDNNDDYDYKKITITIKPKEKPITDILLSELSIINNSANKQQNIPIMKHLISEYISASKTLLENDKKEKFYLLTNWFSQKLNYSLESFSKEFQNEVFVNPLLEFQEYLSQNYDFVTTSFSIYMKNIIKS